MFFILGLLAAAKAAVLIRGTEFPDQNRHRGVICGVEALRMWLQDPGETAMYRRSLALASLFFASASATAQDGQIDYGFGDLIGRATLSLATPAANGESVDAMNRGEIKGPGA